MPVRGSKRARTDDDEPSAGLIALHRSRFIDWQPAEVVALAASGDGSVVAAAREDGDIELYETTTSHCFQRLPGHKDSCLTCVALVDEEEGKGSTTSRLFSSGLDGVLLEWDVEHRQPGTAADSLGGAVWQLAPEPGACIKSDADARIAAACDDGCARIFIAQSGTPGLTYSRSLPRVEGRTLAVAWHPSGKVLATAGTDGCIHLWSLDTCHELLRITTGDGSGAASSQQACIWTLLVLRDGTVVSGDSSGNVQFWDGRFGTLLAGFAVHQADVLQLAGSPDGNMVFAAGVDPQVALFHRLPAPSSSSRKHVPWAYLSSKRPHTHDVRAMCIAQGKALAQGPRLFTGSNDSQLFNHSVDRYLKEHPFRVNACPQPPLLHTVNPVPPPGLVEEDEARPAWLLCAQRTEVDLWQLVDTAAASQAGPPAEGVLLPPSAPPEHLLKMEAAAGDHISAACVSGDGRWLAYSDSRRISCFSLERREADEVAPEDYVMPAAVQLPADVPPASHLAFRPGSHELIACAADGTLRLINLPACQHVGQSGQPADIGMANGIANGVGGAHHDSEDEEVEEQQGEQLQEKQQAVQALRAVHDLQYKSSLRRDRQRNAARRLMPLVELMTVSPDGSWLAVSVRQRVYLLNLTSHKLVHSLPPLADPQPPITAISFTADSTTLVVVGSTHQLAAYSAATGQPTDWSAKHSGSLPPKLLKMPGNINSIASCPLAPSSLFLASSEAACHIDMAAPLSVDDADGGSGGKRKRRRSKPSAASEPVGTNCRMLYCAEPVLHAAYVAPDALLVVERGWSQVFEKVAAPMYRHRYGT
ncbi:WD repeat-containing protein PCN [Chlorella vulgaris]